jgi:hypothetical protein
MTDIVQKLAHRRWVRGRRLKPGLQRRQRDVGGNSGSLSLSVSIPAGDLAFADPVHSISQGGFLAQHVVVVLGKPMGFVADVL